MSPRALETALSLREARRLLDAGEVSATELLEHVIGRVEATEPQVHAYASLDLDRARRDAAEADRSKVRGRLHGIPFGVKDVFAVAGDRTGCGSRALADHVTRSDAAVVRALRAAGAVLVGKTVTHELTCGVDEPPTRNPHDPARYPGGSSVGSAVSVAVGSALFAIGTDAAGSVRIPASANGIVGLKPTRGLLDTAGIVRAATAPSIDHVGILARTVEDATTVLEALAPQQPDRTEGDVRGTRIGVPRFDDVDPEVAELVDTAVADLAASGAHPVPVDVAEMHEAPIAVATYFAAELAAGNRDLWRRRRDDYHPAVRDLLAGGFATTEAELRAARETRERVGAALSTTVARHRLDALLSPTMPVVPPALADLDPAVHMARIVACTCPFNLTGQPAVSVPCGVTAAGVPVGLQVAGPARGESTVLRIAARVARPTPPNPTWS